MSAIFEVALPASDEQQQKSLLDVIMAADTGCYGASHAIEDVTLAGILDNVSNVILVNGVVNGCTPLSSRQQGDMIGDNKRGEESSTTSSGNTTDSAENARDVHTISRLAHVTKVALQKNIGTAWKLTRGTLPRATVCNRTCTESANTRQWRSYPRSALRAELQETQRQRSPRDAERAEWKLQAAQQARQSEQERNVTAGRAEASFAGRQHFARQAIRRAQQRPIAAAVFARVARLDVAHSDDECVREGYGAHDIAQLADALSRDDARDVLRGVEDELDFVNEFQAEGDDDAFNRARRLAFSATLGDVLRVNGKPLCEWLRDVRHSGNTAWEELKHSAETTQHRTGCAPRTGACWPRGCGAARTCLRLVLSSRNYK